MLRPLLQEYMGAKSASTRVSDTSVRSSLICEEGWHGRTGGREKADQELGKESRIATHCRRPSTQAKNIIIADRSGGSNLKRFSFPVLQQVWIQRF